MISTANKAILIDQEVLSYLRERALPYETPNHTMRRIFGLTPTTVRRGWPKGRKKIPKLRQETKKAEEAG